jgi:hypothetical protein
MIRRHILAALLRRRPHRPFPVLYRDRLFIAA